MQHWIMVEFFATPLFFNHLSSFQCRNYLISQPSYMLSTYPWLVFSNVTPTKPRSHITVSSSRHTSLGILFKPRRHFLHCLQKQKFNTNYCSAIFLATFGHRFPLQLITCKSSPKYFIIIDKKYGGKCIKYSIAKLRKRLTTK